MNIDRAARHAAKTTTDVHCESYIWYMSCIYIYIYIYIHMHTYTHTVGYRKISVHVFFIGRLGDVHHLPAVPQRRVPVGRIIIIITTAIIIMIII